MTKFCVEPELFNSAQSDWGLILSEKAQCLYLAGEIYQYICTSRPPSLRLAAISFLNLKKKFLGPPSRGTKSNGDQLDHDDSRISGWTWRSEEVGMEPHLFHPAWPDTARVLSLTHLNNNYIKFLLHFVCLSVHLCLPASVSAFSLANFTIPRMIKLSFGAFHDYNSILIIISLRVH